VNCADEVTLSRKGAKSRKHARGFRSTRTKGTRVSLGQNAFVELERQLEVRTRELAVARDDLAEALEQQTAMVLAKQVIASLNMFGVYECAVCSENEAWIAEPGHVRYFEWPEAGLFADG
jgi:hypothetical protein